MFPEFGPLRVLVEACLQRARHGPISEQELQSALREPLVPGCDRWELWALICFLRQERRQEWVRYVVESRLGGSGHSLGTRGAFGHPEALPQSGPVPEEPGWSYYFHGRGCCLTHADGTSLDVDFADDGSAAEIDPHFFTDFLSSHPNPAWVECQLRHPEPFASAWHFDLSALAARGWITHAWRFQLTKEGRGIVQVLEPLVDELEALLQTNAQPSALLTAVWLALLLSDPLGAAQIMAQGQCSSLGWVQDAASQCLQRRAEFARSCWPAKADALAALAVLGSQYGAAAVEQALLLTPVTSSHHFALSVLEYWDDAAATPHLLRALRQFAPATGPWRWLRRQPTDHSMDERRARTALLVALCRALLRRHTPATLPASEMKHIAAALRGDTLASSGQAAALLFLVDAPQGLARLAASLNHSIPHVRMEAAAYLATISDSEAVRLLITRAGGPAENGGHEAACALGLLQDEAAQRAADHWSTLR